jgi:hypothetical protein
MADLLGELLKRQLRASFSAEALCFGPQRAAVRSPAKRKVLRCGRRAGKTTGAAIALLEAALRPPAVPVVYLTLTRANAKEIIWGDLLKLNEDYCLGGVPHLQDLTLTMPGGAQLQLRGLNSERELAKVRGKKFKLAIIDEAQAIPDRILRPLVTSDLGPTLQDYDGEMWLVGTPPPVKAGYFWESYAGKLKHLREQHHWTIRQNEKFPALLAGKPIERILAGVLEDNGWTDQDSTYRREYEGEDVEDTDSLLFQFSVERNLYQALPEGRWSYVFGVDQGHDDSDAIAVLGWVEGDPRLYLVDEYVQAKEDVTDLAEALKERIAAYKPIRIAIDQGGGGKKAAAELTRRHGIALQPAEKAQKAHYIRLLNADLRKARLLTRAESRFAEDCKMVQKDPKALLNGELREKPKGAGGYHSDICDAVLYGWRAALHFLEEPAPPPPTTQQKLDAWEREEADRIEKRHERDWLEDRLGGLGYD